MCNFGAQQYGHALQMSCVLHYSREHEPASTHSHCPLGQNSYATGDREVVAWSSWSIQVDYQRGRVRLLADSLGRVSASAHAFTFSSWVTVLEDCIEVRLAYILRAVKPRVQQSILLIGLVPPLLLEAPKRATKL